VTIDDAGAGSAVADLRINGLYEAPGVMADLRHVPLRPEFQAAHEHVKAIREDVRELLITQGGSDTCGFTPKILHALEGLRHRPHCTVVLGPAFRHEPELTVAVSHSTLDLSIVRCPRHMVPLMQEADVAITAGGMTMFELACVGTPSVVICGEPFEVETARRFERAGIVKQLGFGGEVDYARLPTMIEDLSADVEERTQMSRRAQQLVDGWGCERILNVILERAMASTERLK
jgi:spore coat polysaccharide biosynthesis predicted glycosyltransferase SpsG